jgi:hypothetical protein
MVQLGIWVTAQFTRLAALVREVRMEQHYWRQQEQLRRYVQQPQQPQLRPQVNEPVLVTAAASSAISASDSADSNAASTPAGASSSATSSLTAAVTGLSSATLNDPAVGDSATHSDDAQMVPFLPLIIIQGQDWYFLAASQNASGGTVRRTSQFFFFSALSTCGPNFNAPYFQPTIFNLLLVYYA